MTSVNLMPAAERQFILLRSCASLWIKIYVGAAMLATVAFASAWMAERSTAQQKASLNARYVPIKRMSNDIRSAEQQTSQLQQRESVVLNLANRRSAVSLLGAISQTASEVRHEVYVKGIEFHTSGIKTKARQSRLIIRGVGADDASIAAFVEKLKAKKMFDNIELTSRGAEKAGDVIVRNFTVECVTERE